MIPPARLASILTNLTRPIPAPWVPPPKPKPAPKPKAPRKAKAKKVVDTNQGSP